jgi:HSP20 family molecular chaperone IbpA
MMDSPNAIIVQAELPGIHPKDINAEVYDDKLFLWGDIKKVTSDTMRLY